MVVFADVPVETLVDLPARDPEKACPWTWSGMAAGFPKDHAPTKKPGRLIFSAAAVRRQAGSADADLESGHHISVLT
jgi:hypothetical protein